MRLNEYTPLALRTESKPAIYVFIKEEGIFKALSDKDAKDNYEAEYEKQYVIPRLNHAQLGILSEYAELKDDSGSDAINYLEEFGDLAWYLNLACDALDISLDELQEITPIPEFEEIDLIGILGGHLADKVKRLLFYGTTLDKVQKTGLTLREDITSLLAGLKYCLLTGCSEYGLDIEEVLERNIDKLSARYPDKFSSERALDRDLNKEKLALDGETSF
jgi:NTP pyrophosphatase (non-canonical NTP hydrolase)